jgi:hypothetical protein
MPHWREGDISCKRINRRRPAKSFLDGATPMPVDPDPSRPSHLRPKESGWQDRLCSTATTLIRSVASGAMHGNSKGT